MTQLLHDTVYEHEDILVFEKKQDRQMTSLPFFQQSQQRHELPPMWRSDVEERCGGAMWRSDVEERCGGAMWSDTFYRLARFQTLR